MCDTATDLEEFSDDIFFTGNPTKRFSVENFYSLGIHLKLYVFKKIETHF